MLMLICMQVMLERYKEEKELEVLEKKFWVPKELTVAQLGAKVRYECDMIIILVLIN